MWSFFFIFATRLLLKPFSLKRIDHKKSWISDKLTEQLFIMTLQVLIFGICSNIFKLSAIFTHTHNYCFQKPFSASSCNAYEDWHKLKWKTQPSSHLSWGTSVDLWEWGPNTPAQEWGTLSEEIHTRKTHPWAIHRQSKGIRGTEAGVSLFFTTPPLFNQQTKINGGQTVSLHLTLLSSLRIGEGEGRIFTSRLQPKQCSNVCTDLYVQG